MPALKIIQFCCSNDYISDFLQDLVTLLGIMGSKTSQTVNQSELSEMREILEVSQIVLEDEIELYYCCGFEVRRIPRQIFLTFSTEDHKQDHLLRILQTWKINFEENCNSLKGYYKWVSEVRGVANQGVEPRRHFYGQILQLRYQIYKQQQYNINNNKSNKTKEGLRQILDSSVFFPEEIEVGRSRMGTSLKLRKNTANSIKTRNSILLLDQSEDSDPNNNTAAGMHRRFRSPSAMSGVFENLQDLFSMNRKRTGTFEAGPLSDEAVEGLKLFVRCCEIIENHFCNPSSVFYRLKTKFVKYLSEQYQELSPVDENHHRRITNDIRQFIKLCLETIIDYYKLQLLQEIQPSSAVHLFDSQNIQNATTSILFKDSTFYKILFNLYSKFNESKERGLRAAINKKRLHRTEEYGIKDEYCMNKKTIFWFRSEDKIQTKYEGGIDIKITPYSNCSEKLKQLSLAHTPIAKLKVLVSTADKITGCIQDFYSDHGIEGRHTMMDADQVLSIFQFIIVNTDVRDFYSHLNIIQNFAGEEQLMSMTGYYFSVVLSAVESLRRHGDDEV